MIDVEMDFNNRDIYKDAKLEFLNHFSALNASLYILWAEVVDSYGMFDHGIFSSA